MSFKFSKKFNQDPSQDFSKFDSTKHRKYNGLENVNRLALKGTKSIIFNYSGLKKKKIELLAPGLLKFQKFEVPVRLFEIANEQNPPSYFDLGKRARDLFNTGYHFGLLSLNVITKSPNNVKFTTTCVENIKQRNLFGSVEAKYELPESLILTERWNTDCTVTTEICCKNKPINGFSITFAGSISPRNGEKIGSVKAEFKNKFCSLFSQIDLKNKYSLLTSSAVVGYHGLLWGILAKFDTHSYKLNDLNFAAGFSTDDFILHTTFNNCSECGGSIFHKVSPKVDIGVDVIYSTNKTSDILFGIAGRYQFDDDVCIRGKINNSSQLGLGLEQKLRDCIVLTWSVLFDIRNFESGKHKLGLSIQFES